MKKTAFQRSVALVLAVLFLLGGGSVAAAAESSGAPSSSVTNETLKDIYERLNALTYGEYIQTYSELNSDTNKYEWAVPKADTSIIIDALNYLASETTAKVSESTYDGVKALYTPDTGIVAWEINVPSTARYNVKIEYYPVEGKAASIERIFMINGKVPFAEARYLTLSKVWKNEYRIAVKDGETAEDYLNAAARIGIQADKKEESYQDKNGQTVTHTYVVCQLPEGGWTEEIVNKMTEEEFRLFTTDIDGNELRPTTYQAPEWKTYELKDYEGFYTDNFEVVLTAGKNVISLQAQNEPMAIKSIEFYPSEGYKTYEEISANYDRYQAGQSTVRIEGEYTSATSDQTIYSSEERSSAVNSPTDVTRTLLNTLGGEKWQVAGQTVTYDFAVSSSGLYDIVARFRQNILEGVFTSRRLYIYSGEGVSKGEDGYYNGIPCEGATRLKFDYSTEWQTTSLYYINEEGEKQELELYFKEGVKYTLVFEATLGDMGSVVRGVSDSLGIINDSYLKILSLTGSSPDINRDYDFMRVMPDAIINMLLESANLENVSKELVKISGEKSSNTATLDYVSQLLLKMGSDEDEVARNLSELKSYIGTLGTWVSDAKTSPLQLDYIQIQGTDKDIPQANANFWQAFLHELSCFWQSFIRNYNRMGSTVDNSENQDAVEVWLAYGRDQTQVIRNLINNDFTPSTGIPIDLKLVAGGTLLPSILAKAGPDVYIGVGDDTVINYAIRGALLNVENYEGFNEIAINEDTRLFNEAAMLVLGIADSEDVFHYYGLPETQSFSMMFCRTDILAELGLDVPKTWDDILAAVPVLQANNMEIGLSTDYKIFLYQYGGELFADDGMRINLDSNVALESFQRMCDFFTNYKFPYSYDFANRFRTGEMPIGLAGYTGTYNQLTVFATELKGLWQFYPLPGIEDADGNINNVAVSSVSAICMIAGCDQEEEAWEFMKWHVGEDCQVQYANEMVAILGPSAKHSTANMNALASLPWTTEEYKQVYAQFNNLASIPNYPGAYIIGRYTNFAFLAAYNDNLNPVDELKSYIATINKEITRKRKEFELETLEIGQTLADKRLAQTLSAIDGLIASEAQKYSAQLEAVKEAIKLVPEDTKSGIDEEITQQIAKVAEAIEAIAVNYEKAYDKLVAQYAAKYKELKAAVANEVATDSLVSTLKDLISQIETKLSETANASISGARKDDIKNALTAAKAALNGTINSDALTVINHAGAVLNNSNASVYGDMSEYLTEAVEALESYAIYF